MLSTWRFYTMNITILPESKVEITVSNNNGKKTKAVKMLGELSLELLNFAYEPVCKKAFELAERLTALQPSKRLTSLALEYTKEVKKFLDDYIAFNAEAASTPLSDFISSIGVKGLLQDLLLEDADDGETVKDAIVYYGDDERAVFTDDENFETVYRYFVNLWKQAYEALTNFRQLFSILLYSKEKSLVEKIQDFGIENLNEYIKNLGGADIYYSITSHENKVVFTESYSVNISQLLVLEFVKMLQAGITIKCCLNCGNLFALYSGHKNNYCSSIPAGETQSCYIVGPINLFKKKTQGNPLLKMFDKVKKRIHARGTRNGTGYKFENWSQIAVKIRDEAIANNLTPEEMEKRLEAASQTVGI